jgi:hypothetical protein
MEGSKQSCNTRRVVKSEKYSGGKKWQGIKYGKTERKKKTHIMHI